MIILIAESKTMSLCDRPVSQQVLTEHTPVFETEANSIMESIGSLPSGEISSIMKVSPAMERKIREMVYEFSNKSAGAPAITAYTGVVFKALDYPSLSEEEKRRTLERVHIISSLYGWLRPDDIVKSYRLDFTTPIAPDGGAISHFWKPKVTAQLLETISTVGGEEWILDLLPGDATKCIDRKRVEDVAKIWKVDIKTVLPGGAQKTPDAGRLKTLRGKLLRQIIQQSVTDPYTLSALEGEVYVGTGLDETTRTIRFQTVESEHL